MPRLFLGNFDCEYDWGAPAGDSRDAGRPTSPLAAQLQRARQHSAALAPAWLALAQADDVILAETRWTEAHFVSLQRAGVPLPTFARETDQLPADPQRELIPWGWTVEAVATAQRHSALIQGPDPLVAARVNARAFRFELECALQIAPPGSRLIATLADFHAALQAWPQADFPWILKANYGMSGREAIRGRGRDATPPQIRFVETRLAASGPLVLEPFLEAHREAGLLLDVPAHGPPRRLGVAEQIVHGGSWRGSRFFPGEGPACDWHPALEVADTVAARLQQHGYWGPLGIDAMWYRDAEGTLRLRPLMDLNARFTMGRLALAWRRLAPADWCGAWLMLEAGPVGFDWPARTAAVASESQGAAQALLTSPWPLPAGRPARVSVLLLAASTEECNRQITRLLGAAPPHSR